MTDPSLARDYMDQMDGELRPGDFVRVYSRNAARDLKRRESHWADLILADKEAPFTLGVAVLVKDRERSARLWKPAVRYQRNVLTEEQLTMAPSGGSL